MGEVEKSSIIFKTCYNSTKPQNDFKEYSELDLIH